MLMIKKNFVWILFAFALVLFIVKFYPFNTSGKNGQPFYKTVQIDGGWGYDIYKKDSLYIHQMTIPALEGLKTFKTESDAKKVASLVLEKMKYNQFPVISLKELDSLNIH